MEKNLKLITYEKEHIDSLSLIEKIVESKWVTKDTVIINCNPEYSSRITQLVNHKLSFLNKNELFEVRNLNMPYPVGPQVWDNDDFTYKLFIRYLSDWTRKNISSSEKYLLLSSDISGSEFGKIRLFLKDKTDLENFRFGTIYLDNSCTFVPDFYVEKVPTKSIIYQWENANNPNWDF